MQSSQQTLNSSKDPAPRSFRVLHMASCARSGETLVLRLLAAHPEILVAFDLSETNEPSERAMRELFKSYAGLEISESQLPSTVVAPPTARAIVVKQGVWEHRHPFTGFVLVRNPASVVASLLDFDVLHRNGRPNPLLRLLLRTWRRDLPYAPETPHWERILRWVLAIDEELAVHLRSLDYVSALCAFYNRRMLPLIQLNLPVLHYERLVTEPDEALRSLMARLSLPFHSSMLESHRAYEPGTIGHGKSDLTRTIDQKSLSRYKEILNERQFSKVAALTYPTWKAYGYNLSYDNISVDAPRD